SIRSTAPSPSNSNDPSAGGPPTARSSASSRPASPIIRTVPHPLRGDHPPCPVFAAASRREAPAGGRGPRTVRPGGCSDGARSGGGQVLHEVAVALPAVLGAPVPEREEREGRAGRPDLLAGDAGRTRHRPGDGQRDGRGRARPAGLGGEVGAAGGELDE